MAVEQDGSVILENGVKIRTTAVPSAIVRNLIAQVKRPSPPIVTLRDGSQEENPNDPGYLDELGAYHGMVVMANMRAAANHGTEPVAWPPGFPTWDSDEWVEDFESSGVLFHKEAGVPAPIGHIDISTPHRRKFQWKIMVAIGSCSIVEIFHQVVRKSATIEAEVAEAQRFFQNRKERETAGNNSDKESGNNGNNVRPDMAGDSPTNGGNAGSQGVGDPVAPLVQAPAPF